MGPVFVYHVVPVLYKCVGQGKRDVFKKQIAAKTCSVVIGKQSHYKNINSFTKTTMDLRLIISNRTRDKTISPTYK